MLSDEEKQAIKVLNHFNPVDCGREDTQAIETILKLIEKQQKEIEELKKLNIENEKTYTQLGEIIGEKKVEDKIKEKVIEIKNKPVKDEFITASQGKLDTIIEIEELKGNKKFLEKQEIEYIRDRTEDEVNIKWEDKIKAKIEEYENKIKKIRSKKLINEPEDTINITRYVHYISVLQSLLEKE